MSVSAAVPGAETLAGRRAPRGRACWRVRASGAGAYSRLLARRSSAESAVIHHSIEHWAFSLSHTAQGIETSLAHWLRRTGRGIVHYSKRARRVCVRMRAARTCVRLGAWRRTEGGRRPRRGQRAPGAGSAERWRCAAHLPAPCPARRPRPATTRPENTRKTPRSRCDANTCPYVKTSEKNRALSAMQFLFNYVLIPS